MGLELLHTSMLREDSTSNKVQILYIGFSVVMDACFIYLSPAPFDE